MGEGIKFERTLQKKKKKKKRQKKIEEYIHGTFRKGENTKSMERKIVTAIQTDIEDLLSN